MHDLHHTCATLLLAHGVPLRVVMEIFGHSQISVTANTYTHVLPEPQRDAMNRMNEVFTVPVAVTAAVTKGHRGPADPPATL
jgi:integrase